MGVYTNGAHNKHKTFCFYLEFILGNGMLLYNNSLFATFRFWSFINQSHSEKQLLCMSLSFQWITAELSAH